MELKRRMCTCFSSFLLFFVPLVFFLCVRYSSRLKAPDRTSGLPASQEFPRHLDYIIGALCHLVVDVVFSDLVMCGVGDGGEK